MIRSLRSLLAAILVSFGLAACGGGVATQTQPRAQADNGGPGAAGLTAVYPLSPSAASYKLPFPRGYDGTMSLGPNNAPAGTRLTLNVAEAGLTAGAAATTGDPFPILVNFEVPVTVTVPVPGFVLQLPQAACGAGKIDVAFFDPTKPPDALTNPLPLGQAFLNGNTLTFTPPPNKTLTLIGGVHYTFTFSRDVSNLYSGAAASVLFPVQANTLQSLADVGPLGADVKYQASGTGFLQWQTISGSPGGIQQLISGAPPESVVVSATQPVTLSSVTMTGDFSNGGSLPSSLGTGGTGAFVPDTNPTVLGPFPVTLGQKKATFTVSAPSGLHVDSHKAWDFSLVTVTACVPTDVHQPCDSSNVENAATSVPVNTQFHVLVSDFSGLLNKAYGISVAAPCSAAEINQNDNDGDMPPGYNDNPTGPNAEFTLLSSAVPCTCTITVSYNGGPVAQTTIAVGSSSLSAVGAAPFSLRPPVNAPSGFAVSGKI